MSTLSFWIRSQITFGFFMDWIKTRVLLVSIFALFFASYCFRANAGEFIPTTTVEVEMRDGVRLPTDIYHPGDLQQRYPCLLIRSPAGRKAPPWVGYAILAKAGYVVAIQDTRNCLDLDGKTLPFYSDGWGKQQDGYDAVEWLAKSEWSNGKVGTIGSSACGITQCLLAPTAPPSLSCQYIGVAASSLYHHAIYPQGKLLESQVDGWLGTYAKDPSVRAMVLAQSTYNDFWRGFDMPIVADKVQAPALHYGGWYDTFIQGTLDAFVAIQDKGGERARLHQKLIIGPWTHGWPKDIRLGDFQMPANALAAPWDMSPLAWFGHHLKGEDNSVKEVPAVTYYTMGPFDDTPSSGNVWHTAERWPIPAKQTEWYLGSHTLMTEMPPRISGVLYYSLDLQEPIPTQGGANLFLSSGPKDQSTIEKRSDLLLFTSPPLSEEVEVTGRMAAKIYYTATRYPCDIAVRLCDVYPDGRSILIADGMVSSAPTKPGEVAIATIDLLSTSMVFAKGHRIRISVGSSNYPRYATMDGAGSVGVAIHYGATTPSHITLPVVVR